MSVGGTDSALEVARRCEDSERAFRLVRLAFSFVLACCDMRKDVGRHARGQAGTSGVDSLATLAEWRTNNSWYLRAKAGDEGAIPCGLREFLIPLRSVPRISTGGNLFLGGMVQFIADVAASFPRTPGGMMSGSLLQMARRMLLHADSVAHVDAKQARAIIYDWNRLPVRSMKAARVLLEIESVSRLPWNITFASGGNIPFMLPETERVFQQVAVSAVLIALGLPAADCDQGLATARSRRGLQIGDQYQAWYDTPSHALVGWRAETQAPSHYRPDLIVQRKRDGAWLLIDAKLRQGQGGESLFSQSAIKEMQAYMQEYRLVRSVLLVPSVILNEWTYGDVEGDGCHIRAIGVPASKKLFGDSDEARIKLEEMWNR